MTFQPHLQPINFSQATYDDALNFALFALLPKELRTKIWRHALYRQRIIRLRIRNETGKRAFHTSEKPDCVENGERYSIIVDSRQPLSKLLRVNRESREEVLRFYRVHLLCRFTGRATKEGSTSHGTFHFNPEWDFLYLSAEWPAKDTLIAFFHRLKKTHDPRSIGLLNLAINGNDLSRNDIQSVQPSDVEAETRAAFVETLTQLRQVWFVSTPLVGRQMVGPLSGFPISGAMFNRSFPILTTTAAFERLPRDPRRISQDLAHASGLGGLRDLLLDWLRLLRAWQVSPPRDAIISGYRFLLAFDPKISGAKSGISDQEGAETWLQLGEDQWHGRGPPDPWLKGTSLKYPVGAHDEKYRNEDLEKAVRPAFGFWLFPLEALARVDVDDDNLLLVKGEPARPGGEMFRDVTAHWPELALSSLP